MADLNFEHLYGSEYFDDRFIGTDKKRELSYKYEHLRIMNFIQHGKILDIGCGMGNFLQMFDDNFDKYGIEISSYAASKAMDNGIKIIDYNFEEDFFDLIILRGVFQHLCTPLFDLKNALKMLKKGGFIVFLATSNSNSIYYKFFGTLPMLDPERNFVIPSDIMLKQILKNFGCDILDVQFPYLKSPYSSPLLDHLKFFANCIGFNFKFAFWRNFMEIYAKKVI